MSIFVCLRLSAVNWEKNRKTFFDFLSPGLGINVSLFRLRQFEKVGSELGSPVAGVEIGTGWKRALFYTFWKKAGHCRTNTLGAMNFLIFFYFFTFSAFFLKIYIFH